MTTTATDGLTEETTMSKGYISISMVRAGGQSVEPKDIVTSSKSGVSGNFDLNGDVTLRVEEPRGQSAFEVYLRRDLIQQLIEIKQEGNKMGLDMYLYEQIYLGNDIRIDTRYRLIGVERDLPSNYADERLSYALVRVAYWRKANAVHRYFVSQAQGGGDDCYLHHVEHRILANLVHRCKQILDDPSKAETLLPTAEGFFFGGIEYDEGYFDSLRSTIAMLTPLIDEPNDRIFYYDSSW